MSMEDSSNFHYCKMNDQLFSKIKAFIFDLDGTVVDSGLDFDLMREELGFPHKAPILEEVEKLTDKEQIQKAHEIIHKHELEGVRRATLMPGYRELHQYIKSKNLPIGLLTRNSSPVTNKALEKFDLEYDMVLTRDDCLAKPHPDGLNIMKEKWKLGDFEAIYIGDFQFDLITARAANLYGGLYLNSENTHLSIEADVVIDDYFKMINLFKMSWT